MWKSCCVRLTLILNHIIKIFFSYFILYAIFFFVFTPRFDSDLSFVHRCLCFCLSAHCTHTHTPCKPPHFRWSKPYTVSKRNEESIIAYGVQFVWYLTIFWNCKIDIKPNFDLTTRRCGHDTHCITSSFIYMENLTAFIVVKWILSHSLLSIFMECRV